MKPRRDKYMEAAPWVNYDPETGVFTCARESPHIRRNHRFLGDEIPITQNNGTAIVVGSFDVQAGILAWYMHTGEVVSGIIHKDGDKSNLKFDNLVPKELAYKQKREKKLVYKNIPINKNNKCSACGITIEDLLSKYEKELSPHYIVAKKKIKNKNEQWMKCFDCGVWSPIQ